TPPLGHPLCGGWIEPARVVDDPLQALGVVLLGMGRPVVLCAVDWCGLRNEAHSAWRRALAEAAQTVPERVAVQCVHQHNAPFADLEAERLLAALPGAPSSLNLRFFDQAVGRTADAVRESLKRARPWTHLGVGQARVEQVASNRRLLGPDGKVQFVRVSATKDARIRAAPEGLIDPWLKTLSFWNRSRPLAALHYYATHPMSYYGDGRVRSDFAGLARRKRQEDDPQVLQVYFTGCAGNITAGKYNDGAHANRPVLRDRLYAAMKAAWEASHRQAVSRWQWRVEPVKLPVRSEASFGMKESRRVLEDPRETRARRVNAAFQLAWRQRAGRPIDLTCLDLGTALVVHLPGEPFIEYQLKAQQLRPEDFVCVAGYGDGGPGYIPTARAYAEGGYEPTVALAGPDSERILHQALARLLQVPG
ncbi:MAG: hypothetical protein JO112_11610, partial [Planctomycetes bacterium]|nr:hypothetical protein [Planctomycetota bacterium]